MIYERKLWKACGIEWGFGSVACFADTYSSRESVYAQRRVGVEVKLDLILMSNRKGFALESWYESSQMRPG